MSSIRYESRIVLLLSSSTGPVCLGTRDSRTQPRRRNLVVLPKTKTPDRGKYMQTVVPRCLRIRKNLPTSLIFTPVWFIRRVNPHEAVTTA